MRVTKHQVYEAIAKSLREFGYPDVTKEMIGEVHDDYAFGKRGHDLPHGIVGMFAERQLDDAVENGLLEKPLTVKVIPGKEDDDEGD